VIPTDVLAEMRTFAQSAVNRRDGSQPFPQDNVGLRPEAHFHAKGTREKGQRSTLYRSQPSQATWHWQFTLRRSCKFDYPKRLK
jgi:hypothetical protein